MLLPLLALVLAALLAICPAGYAFADAPFEGAGTSESPYKISDGEQLKKLAELVNAGTSPYPSAHYALTANVGIGTWTPIGTKNNPFKGTFDGQGYKVTGLNVGGSYVGLFGYVSGGAIKNLGVVNVSVNGSDHVGGIAGYIKGTIANCWVTGSVSGANYIGGIAGTLEGASSSISASYSEAAVRGSTNKVGGIVGQFTGGKVSDCYSTGDVTSARDSGTVDIGDIGGIVGGVPSQSSTGSIERCYSTGTVEGWNYAGGIAGNLYGNASVKDSVALNPAVIVKDSGYVE